jgi:hypothetical protein
MGLCSNAEIPTLQAHGQVGLDWVTVRCQNIVIDQLIYFILTVLSFDGLLGGYIGLLEYPHPSRHRFYLCVSWLVLKQA